MSKTTNAKRSGTRDVNNPNNRSKPMTPKAGFTMKRSRYKDGGKTCK